MRVISLNVWGGRKLKPLLKFLKENEDAEIFCFQEMWHSRGVKERAWDDRGNKAYTDLFARIRKILPKHAAFYSIHEDELDDKPPRGLKAIIGITVFVKEGVKIRAIDDHFVHKNRNCMRPSEDVSLDQLGNGGRSVQIVEIEHRGKPLAILNFHGLWNGKGKTDCSERLEQSRKVRKIMDSIKAPKILCGDFNLEPDTESLAILEKGMVNLVKKFGVTDTRGKLYPKPVRFADYMLVSPKIKVKKFEVPNVAVSDHLPLIAKFDIKK